MNVHHSVGRWLAELTELSVAPAAFPGSILSCVMGDCEKIWSVSHYFKSGRVFLALFFSAQAAAWLWA